MKYNPKNSIVYILFISIISTGIFSCIPAKQLNYLQENKETAGAKYSAKNQQYKVQSGDNLYIKLSSLDPETALILEPAGQNINSQNDGERKYKGVYLIDTKGYVDIPQIGDVYVKDLSLDEIKDTVDYSISKYFKQINVQVRLADAYVTILGEVKEPGRYMIDFDDKITIFDLLGLSGDLTKHANRKNLKLVRKNGKNTEIIHIDLTDKKILEKEYFYLMPNDIIYIEQLDAVYWDSSSFPFYSSLSAILTTTSTILSTTTSIFVLLTYLKNNK